MSTKTLMTVEEFAQMIPTEIEDFELVAGELIPLSSGTYLHAKIRGRTEFLISNYFERNPIGEVVSEVDCRLRETTVRRPDVSVFFNDRLRAIDRQKIPLPCPPDIAVEVLSPSESAVDVNRKVLDYLAAGSQEVWSLDYSNGEVFIQTNSGIRLFRGQDVVESPLLPGFGVVVDKLLGGF